MCNSFMGYTYELGPAYSGSARPRAVKDRRLHTAPITSEPRLIARGTIAAVRLSITELRTSRRPLFDFHRIGKKQKYKAYHSIGLFAFLRRVPA